MFCFFTYHVYFIMFCFLLEMFILRIFFTEKSKTFVVAYLVYLIKISSNKVSLNDSLSLMPYNWCWYIYIYGEQAIGV